MKPKGETSKKKEIGGGYDWRLLSSLNEAKTDVLRRAKQAQNLPIWEIMLATIDGFTKES